MKFHALDVKSGCARCDAPVTVIVLLTPDAPGELEHLTVGVDGPGGMRVMGVCRSCCDHLIETHRRESAETTVHLGYAAGDVYWYRNDQYEYHRFRDDDPKGAKSLCGDAEKPNDGLPRSFTIQRGSRVCDACRTFPPVQGVES